MGNHKSPGTDGLPKEFYLTFWDPLKDNLLEILNFCLNSGKLCLSQRRGMMTLLLKKDDKELLKNWRPISLLNTDYKLLAKALANRLRKVLHLLIHPNQVCSVPDRCINEHCSLLRDICDYANSTNLGCALVSLNQEKAFDWVDWGFLDKVVVVMNFGPAFRSYIRCLYTDIQSAIFFNLERGVRQGCPLSPLPSS